MDLNRDVERKTVKLTPSQVEKLRQNQQYTIYADNQVSEHGDEDIDNNIMPMKTVLSYIKKIDEKTKMVIKKNKHLTQKDVCNIILKNEDILEFYKSHPTVFTVASSLNNDAKATFNKRHMFRIIAGRCLVEEGTHTHINIGNFFRTKAYARCILKQKKTRKMSMYR